jgi:pimeloyl-ACP methyl ester carboxylesterase
MAPQLLEQAGLAGVSASQLVVPVLLAHVAWWKLAPHAQPLGPPVRAALLVMRLTLTVLLLEALICAMVLPALYLVKDNLSMERRWDPLDVPVTAQQQQPQQQHQQLWLSAGVFTPPGTPQGPTILFIAPNGAGFEQMTQYLSSYAEDLGAQRIVAFNYRGVGKSTGFPRRWEDLVDDADAVLKHVMVVYGVRVGDVIAHGWSLGGGVAMSLRTRHPGLVVVNDRSFSSLSSAASGMLGDPVGLGALGLLGGFLLAFVSSEQLVTMADRSKWLCAVLAAVSAAGGLHLLLPSLLDVFCWQVDLVSPPAAAALYSAPTCVVYHRGDPVVVYEASLHRALELGQPALFEFELKADFSGRNEMMHHMYPVTNVAEEWRRLLSDCVRPAWESRALFERRG